MGKLLRVTRIIIASVMLVAATGAAVDCGLMLPAVAGWLEKIQLIPAVMSFSLGYFVFWLIATLIFGRIYCSTVCPLGTFQDICSRLPRMGRHRDSQDYHYHRPFDRTRYISLAIVVASLVTGILLIVSLVDPWCIYSRFCVNVLNPAVRLIVDDGFYDTAAVAVSENPHLKIMGASAIGLVISLVSMGIVGWIAVKSGRTFCNTVCPVGTTLGFISRNSIFHIDIDTDKCIQCRRCEHVCKASCIDLIDHVVDSSRCVTCFDCLPVCPNDAIRYTTERHQLAIPMMQKISRTIAGAGSVNTSAPARGVTPCDKEQQQEKSSIENETIS